ncbi:bifunctional riboflavin kinase/FAD synthetase [Mangrovibacillus cuniculi]|uniref:Riboflavin biosynthesis protein n=1 Tax=Mangrovibacillus cuniculi TaxID=2593652 RepID=A0A7S8CAG0_9BACI|nr:bifunctional riboflavin kinase/FAD synthetase [Mangrovibacillus cuniculi]QPC46389.1 bifunctional riboflavin kinase/FAD synthetase [Mangrovibacillus cuniculi]
MELIHIYHPHQLRKEEFPELSMALGYFDGVHLGHQEVIRRAVRNAKENDRKSAIMTFDPHPSVVLGFKHKHVQFITPLKDKIKLFENLGVDYIFVVRFTSEFASLDPQSYIDQYIIGLHVKHVVAGFDFSYGRLGKGTMETISFHSREAFTFEVVQKQDFINEKVSSTRIREALRVGDTHLVEKLLGRPYTMKGTVIHGDKRGRKIGFPTANIELADDYLLPSPGVYAMEVTIQGVSYEGVCNIGYRPTFKDPNEKKLSIEVHLFQFERSIYGEEITLHWLKRIRNEQKFSGIEELVQQIEKDKQEAIVFFHDRK